MIINVKNKKDTITVDIRCRQIRYMKGAAPAQGPILFYDMTQTDATGSLPGNGSQMKPEPI